MNRAMVRSHMQTDYFDKQMKSMNTLEEILFNTPKVAYNPTGPGDYNLPSSFADLPPPR